MEDIKIKHKNNKMTIEGEFDIELDLTAMHVGYPPEDEEIFKKMPFEIKTYGEVTLNHLHELAEWVLTQNVSRHPGEWPRWKIIFERLDEILELEDYKELPDIEFEKILENF